MAIQPRNPASSRVCADIKLRKSSDCLLRRVLHVELPVQPSKLPMHMSRSCMVARCIVARMCNYSFDMAACNSLQADRWGAELLTEDVESVDLQQRPFTIRGGDRTVRAHSVIIATGATARRLNLPQEETYWVSSFSHFWVEASSVLPAYHKLCLLMMLVTAQLHVAL